MHNAANDIANANFAAADIGDVDLAGVYSAAILLSQEPDKG